MHVVATAILSVGLSLTILSCREQTPAQNPTNNPAQSASSPAPQPQAAPGEPSGAGHQPGADTRPTMLLLKDKPLQVPNGPRVELLSYVVEEIVGEDDESEGEAAVVRLKVGAATISLMDAPDGYGSGTTAWVGPLRFTLRDHQPDRVSLVVERRSKSSVAGSARQVRVERRKTVQLDGDLHLRFAGHGHKTVMAGGPPSPLMVSVDYRRQREVADKTTAATVLDSETYYLEPPEEATWRWRDFRFQLLEHDYNSWMKLKVERLQMNALELDAKE